MRIRLILWKDLCNTLISHQITSAFVAADGGGHQIVRMNKAIEHDGRVTVRLSGSLRRQLEDAAKRDRRRVTEFARIVWQDWLAAHASDTDAGR